MSEIYASYPYRLRFAGRLVAGFGQVSALQRTSTVTVFRDGADPQHERKMPGQTSFPAVTFERGITSDAEFDAWAGLLVSTPPAAGPHRDLKLEVYSESGALVFAWTLHRCWVSEFEAQPTVDAAGNAVAITTLRLEHEGWSTS
ncbi:MAG TPA: phage tail protein [Luteitalea sp.]|nr:phage tail protein [Luteitalea sp.]